MKINKKKSVQTLWTTLVLFTLFILPTKQALADTERPRIELEIHSMRQVIQNINGAKTTVLLPATEGARGETLIYTTNYRNSGKGSAKDVAIVSPIPANTVYIDGSADGKDCKILFSLNQGATYQSPPLTIKTRNSAGEEITIPAPPEMITHIKWIVQIPVKPGGRGTTTYKVNVK